MPVKAVTDLLPAIQTRALLLDGAMGTMLRAQGLPPGVLPEQWMVERPEAVRAVHQAYLDAGSEIILANTFGANRLRLRAWGAEDRVAELNAAAWDLAVSAAAHAPVAGRPVWVAASIGPCGRLASRAEAVEAYDEQIRALARAGCRLLVIETMASLEEVESAVAAATACDPTIAIIAMMTFGRDGRLTTGDGPEAVAARLERLNLLAVGANCSFGPEALVPVIERMAKATSRPLIAKPNAGVPDALAPEAFAAWGERLVAGGARLIGGCCGTTPAHLQRLAARLLTRQPSLPTLNLMGA